MENCIFCKIANHVIESNYAYEDEYISAFYDMDPQAPVHVLIVPKKHIASLDDTTEDDAQLLAHIMLLIKKIAEKEGLENGYRVVVNTGEDGGQTVKHLHFHLLGKRSLNWPPG